jgi:predicted metal-dependent phosphoesterase TrpH
MKIRLKVIIFILLIGPGVAGLRASDVRREIRFPDIGSLKTLKCDFHMHTVFSDGAVWPTVRVDEAWREGLDVIAITDHIEYQPHAEDVPTNHNRPYEIAADRAKEMNILLIKGAEITRDTPPGHFNALFLKDIERLEIEDFNDVVKEANDQGGFVFWNHPGWIAEAKGWFGIHTKLYEKKHLHGIEVVNERAYYPEAHRWALQKNLTMFGNSDIHGPAGEWAYSDLKHRPITLVFAEEKNTEAVKEALQKGRTTVWFEDKLIGREKYLDAIFKASVRVGKPHYREPEMVWLEIENKSDVKIEMERTAGAGPARLLLAANGTMILELDVEEGARQVKLSYVVKNFLTAPDKGLEVVLTIPLR